MFSISRVLIMLFLQVKRRFILYREDSTIFRHLSYLSRQGRDFPNFAIRQHCNHTHMINHSYCTIDGQLYHNSNFIRSRKMFEHRDFFLYLNIITNLTQDRCFEPCFFFFYLFPKKPKRKRFFFQLRRVLSSSTNSNQIRNVVFEIWATKNGFEIKKKNLRHFKDE